MTECHFAPFSQRPCWGRMMRCHLITKQILVKRFGITRRGDLWDPRIWVWGCDAHHHAFDHGFLKLPVSEIPKVALEYVEDHGFDWDWERDDFRVLPEA